jgi:hypothetical protein
LKRGFLLNQRGMREAEGRRRRRRKRGLRLTMASAESGSPALVTGSVALAGFRRGDEKRHQTIVSRLTSFIHPVILLMMMIS